MKKGEDTHSAINKLNSMRMRLLIQQKMLQKDTFKGSLFGYQENVSNTTLTIVLTINVSIDCYCFDVSNPNERKIYTK